MNENNSTPVMLEEEESVFDFMQLWTLFKSHWKWFPVSIVVCVLVAFLYFWFTPTTVTVSNKMLILGDQKQSGAASAKAAVLNSLPLGLGSSLGEASLGIESEKEILMSKLLILDVVNDLALHTEYRMSSWGRSFVVYKTQPLMVELDPAHLQWLDDELLTVYHQINLKIKKSADGYKVETTLILNKDKKELPVKSFASLPAKLQTEYGTLTITENTLLTETQRSWYAGNYTLDVSIVPPMTRAQFIAGSLSIEPPSKKVMNLLEISMSDYNHLRAIDIVNHLVDHYNQRANDEKNEEARLTDEFVNERLAKVDAELGSSDAAWENSKKNFQITTPEVDAQEALTKKSEYEAQLVAIGTQLQLHDYLSDYINNPANLYELIPVGLNSTMGSGSDDGSSTSDGGAANSSLIVRHNSLVSQRKDLLKSVSEMSPQVQRLTESIRELHPDIQLAMKRQRESILMQKRTLEREFDKYSSRIGSAPQMERVLTEIGRQREIKQGVYLVMLQKREEAAMELSKSTKKGKLIDETFVSGPSNPNKIMGLWVAFFLGALLPMGILYLLQMFKQKVDTRSELEAATKLPILAELPHANSDEAIRNLRTKLLLHLKAGQKTILVVSEHDGDGKTFVSQHLVDSLKVISKDAAYIGADYRKASKPGEHAADVLASSDFAAHINVAKANNDYVVIDTPALSQYSDAYQVAQFADVTLYVVKAGQTQKSALQALYTNPHLPNPLIVFNV